MSYGGSSSAYSAAIKRVYGGKYYSANYGFANLSMGLGALISAFSGIVLDAHGGDLYTSGPAAYLETVK